MGIMRRNDVEGDDMRQAMIRIKMMRIAMTMRGMT